MNHRSIWRRRLREDAHDTWTPISAMNCWWRPTTRCCGTSRAARPARRNSKRCTRLRTALKDRRPDQAVPPDLQVRVRERIRARSQRPAWCGRWTKWAGAAAMATLLVVRRRYCGRPRSQPLPGLADRPAQDAYIQTSFADHLIGAEGPGLKDHVHCSIFRKYPQNPPTLEQMAQKLGRPTTAWCKW